ncbi:tetratricopeptide repeat protein [Kitasatospora sp. NPDC097643]|uniref:tetratricopeptide repeat protein n=1 Tax=Kitasatospora sp. NPDC097643 TaxID=3157230 RepID=UPI00331910AA
MTYRETPGIGAGSVRNSADIGLALGTVIQGRDISITLPSRITPAMAGLPPVSPVFTGRAGEVESLIGELAPTAETSPVITLVGLAGVGKTELMLHVASKALARDGWFPGGVLYVDLQGYDPARHRTPDEALGLLLRALAVPAEHAAGDTDYRSALLRSILSTYARAGQRILLLLDNASGDDDLSPLLPSDGATATIVTSRDELGLSSRRHHVDTLDDDAALSLLRAAVDLAHPGDARLDEDPGHAVAIARWCAGLPLALSITAALLADLPTRPLVSLAADLAAEHTRLQKLNLHRRAKAVRAAFDLSYRRLTAEQQRVFCLIPFNAGPDLSTAAVARMAGLAADDAERVLRELARANLVKPEHEWGRWTLHDLVRLYADGESRHLFSDTERSSAIGRLHTHYIDTAVAVYGLPVEHMPEARDASLPREVSQLPRPLGVAAYLVSTYLAAAVTSAEQNVPAPPGGRAADTAITDWEEARSWFKAEGANLMAALEQAVTRQQHEAAFQLGACLTRLLRLELRLAEARTVAAATLSAAGLVGDRRAEAWALNSHAVTLATGIFSTQVAEALTFHEQAIALYEQLGERQGLAWALNGYGINLRRAGRLAEALTAHRRAHELYTDLDDPVGRAWALNSLAITLTKAGRAHEAVDHHAQAMSLYTRNPAGLSWAAQSSQLSDVSKLWSQVSTTFSNWWQRRKKRK